MRDTYPDRPGTRMIMSPLLRSNHSGVDNTHELPVLRTFLFELHVSVLLGEQRVVTTEANIGTGMKAGATLANDDVARNDLLAAVDFDA